MTSASDLVLVPAWAVRDRHAIVHWLPYSAPEQQSEPTLIGCDGAIVVDRSECTVFVDGRVAPLSTTGFLFLESLLASSGEAQHSHDLVKILWGDAAVAPSSLRAVVHAVRRALGPHAAHVRCARKIGYEWQEGCVTSEEERSVG